MSEFANKYKDLQVQRRVRDSAQLKLDFNLDGLAGREMGNKLPHFKIGKEHIYITKGWTPK